MKVLKRLETAYHMWFMGRSWSKTRFLPKNIVESVHSVVTHYFFSYKVSSHILSFPVIKAMNCHKILLRFYEITRHDLKSKVLKLIIFVWLSKSQVQTSEGVNVYTVGSNNLKFTHVLTF